MVLPPKYYIFLIVRCIFPVGSEADKAPKLLAPLFSSEIFRIRGSSGVQRNSTQLIQKPGFIPNNPLGMLAGLFSEIKQGILSKSFLSTTLKVFILSEMQKLRI